MTKAKSVSISAPLRSGHKVITLENIHQAYGENVVLSRHGI